MRSLLPGDFISQKRLVELCDLSNPHQRCQALDPLRVHVAASTFRPWCHRVPGTDKEDENPCYRRVFFVGGGQFHGHPVVS